jgi:hypothetical protein
MRSYLTLVGSMLSSLAACGSDTLEPSDSSASESGSESESGSTDTGDAMGPENDPEAPLDCWESLADEPALATWGLSTQELLLATHEGIKRVEGDAITTLGSGDYSAIWGTDLDHGWTMRDGFGLERIEAGMLEPWHDAVDFDVIALGGRGPEDVWAAGKMPMAGGALAHFDGTSWSTIDVGSQFDTSTFHPVSLHSILVTVEAVYFGGSYGASSDETLLVWDGSMGTTTPEHWAPLTRLSSRDGVHPLWFYLWCDFGCSEATWELENGAWVDGPKPYFDDWDEVLEDLAATHDGTIWALSVSSSPLESHLRVVHHAGTWRRARVPDLSTNIDPMPDGAIVRGYNGTYRATTECLFGHRSR